MKRYINLFLFTVDVTTFIQAVIQFLYYKNYTLGTIIAIICGILSVYLYIENNKNKFYSFVQDYFCFLKELDGRCRLFKTTCIIYICLEILICFLSSFIGNSILILVFWIVFPLVFSGYTIIFNLINKQNTKKIIRLYEITLCFPSLFILVGGIFNISCFYDFILIIIASIIIYLPSYIISEFVIKCINRK